MAKNVRKLQSEIDRSLKQVDEVSTFIIYEFHHIFDWSDSNGVLSFNRASQCLTNSKVD